MRGFYIFWFFFCAGWGYLMATFPTHDAESLMHVLITFPVATFFGAIVTYVGLRGKPPSAANSRLSIDLKPWQQPLGFIQFVTITLVFSAIWGIGLSMLPRGRNVVYPLFMLSLATGSLLGAWAACRVYRGGLTDRAGEKPPAL